jgi:hypothetical protein
VVADGDPERAVEARRDVGRVRTVAQGLERPDELLHGALGRRRRRRGRSPGFDSLLP